jgi:translocator protein
LPRSEAPQATGIDGAKDEAMHARTLPLPAPRFDDDYLSEESYALEHPGRAASAAMFVSLIALCNLAVLVPIMAGEAAYYLSLAKPDWAPEPWVIVPASIGAFTLIGMAAWMVWRSPPDITTSTAMGWLAGTLVLSFAWTPIFFGAHALGTSFLILGTIVIMAGAATVAFGRVSLFAGFLMFLSSAWLAGLAVLGGSIWWLNV